MNDRERKIILEQDIFSHISREDYELIKPLLKCLRPSELLQLQAQAKADRGDQDVVSIDARKILET